MKFQTKNLGSWSTEDLLDLLRWVPLQSTGLTRRQLENRIQIRSAIQRELIYRGHYR